MSRARWLTLGLLVLGVLLLLPAERRPARSSAREADAGLELLHERRHARRALAEAASHERDACRTRLARACEALAAHPSSSRQEANLLRFEAARWWSAAGEQRAQVLWRELVDGASGDVRRRALLELGHVARRGGELSLALERYEGVGADARASARRRDEARWWCARTHELRGCTDEAERSWLWLAREASDPCMRVRAWDRLGCSLLARDESARALEVLASCELSSAASRAECTPTGARVRASFESMTLRRRLEGTTR